MGEAHTEGYPNAYGQWAGNPSGVSPDYKRCCEEVRSPDRWGHYHQCAKPRGHGPNEAYCKQHDPVAVAARKKASRERGDREWQKRRVEIYGARFLAALQQIADGHNDPRTLARETISSTIGPPATQERET